MVQYLLRISCLLFLTLSACRWGAPSNRSREFLDTYNNLAQKLSTVSAEASWKASTDVTDQNTGERIGADRAFAVFSGSDWVIRNSKELLAQKNRLGDLTVRQ